MESSLKMKDGKLLTPFGIRDLLDAVEDYAGEELRREIEEYVETSVEDIDDYEKEYDRMEHDNERLADHQRSVLCNIRDEVDALDTLLQETRLNRRRMLFELDQPEMIKVEEIVLPPKEEESEGETVKKTIYIFPPEWAGTFGQPITSVAQIGILQQEHYAGNWDVLRPASEIKEMNIFTADGLNTLLHEAEEIMEGWIDIDGGKQNVDAAEGAGIGD